MRSLYAWAYVYVLLCSCMLFSAVRDSKLYIQNDHPTFQFECMYKVNGEEMGPITVYKEAIALGTVASVTEVQIKRYGVIGGRGASYYSFPDQLKQCKQQLDSDWVLHIEWSFKGWDVEAKLRENFLKRKALERPLDYFAKASAYGDMAEPRHLLDLSVAYTPQLIAERLNVLTEQVRRDSELTPDFSQQILLLLNEAAVYANQFLAQVDKTSPQFQKLTLEWRGKLHPERVAHGKKVACTLLGGNVVPVAHQDQYLNAIIDLIWFLYDRALVKNQAFDEGVFIIQDVQHRFYDFLMNYIKMVNPTIKDTLDDPPLKISTNTFAYSRLSSHFKIEQDKFRHYGIDIRFNKIELAQTLLPAQKTHILFGHISNELLFIKFENVGIAAQSVIIHGKEFVAAQFRKLFPGLKTYLQAYLPASVDDLLTYYVGTDDDPNYRKERIPQELLQKCLDILKSENLNDNQIRDFMYAFSTQGIHGVYNEIRNATSSLSQAQKTGLNAYLNKLLVQGLDNQAIRYGREVIFTHDELASLCH